jgi:polyvinyl alcohol dehydrogenase (cytochrome)
MRSSTIAIALLLPAFASADDWPMYVHDLAHSSFNSSESSISKDNVSTLTPAWVFDSGAPIASGVTVSGGVIYFGNWKGRFFAVNETDGTILWQSYAGLANNPGTPYCQQAIGVSGQPVLDGDVVYVPGGDSSIYAFNKDNGTLLWRIPLADPLVGSYIWSSLAVMNRQLYVGVSSLGDCPLVPGQLVKIDLDSRNVTTLALSPPDVPGAGLWSTPAIDVESGQIFLATGNGEQDASQKQWGNALMSIDAATLTPKNRFFLVVDPEQDLDWGSSPTLFTTPDGTKLVGATAKDGNLYVRRQDDLSAVWTVQLAVSCEAPEVGCGSLSTPAFDGVTLFAGAGVADINGDNNGSLYALDPATGNQIWMQSFDGVVIAPVTVANGIVYAPTTAGVKAFDAATGDWLWDDNRRATSYGQTAVVNGTVYSTYMSGELVAYKPTVALATDGVVRSPMKKPVELRK